VIALSSVNNLRNAVAVAERKVEQDRNQVAQDEAQLDDSRALLERDSQTLSRTELESRRAQAAATPALSTPRLDRAIDKAIPADALPKPPTVNSLGQTIGKLINVTA